MSEPPCIVLDTQVVLDWLAFRDPAVVPALDAGIGAGHLRWVATEAMRDEYATVLRRGLAERIGVALDAALDGWRRALLLLRAPARSALRCRDADDQKFIDLSLAAGSRWLLTRDRDLLALARPARGAGLSVTTPAAWIAAGAEQGRPQPPL